MQLLSNFKLTDPQRKTFARRFSHHHLLPGNGETHPDSLTQAEIVWGHLSAEAFGKAPCIRLIQLASAGYTQFDTNEMQTLFRERGIILCNGSSVHDEPCAQHAVAMILTLSRGLPRSVRQQGRAEWQPKTLHPELQLLRGRSLATIGYGAIARRMVEMLTPFKMKINAFRRKPRGDENCPTFSLDQLNASLATSDYVVNLLPESPSTHRFFDAGRFQAIKPGAIFVNIGRGKTVDQAALIERLHNGQLAAAALDVTDPEPAPPTDPIWNAPNLLVSPHVAGEYVGMQEDLFEFFTVNLERFDRGEPLMDRVI